MHQADQSRPIGKRTSIAWGGIAAAGALAAAAWAAQADRAADPPAPPAGASAGSAQPDQSAPPPRSRRFLFHYAARVVGLPAGAAVRVWLPHPPTDEYQETAVAARRLPAPARLVREPKYGNQIWFFEAEAPASGRLELSITYRVLRREVRCAGRGQRRATEVPELSERERQLYLGPNRFVPVGGPPLALLAGMSLPKEPLALARALYDQVGRHMRYDKSRPGYGRGDAVWACRSGFGNCTDFHSLFISLARAEGLPARFEIGFPLPEARGVGEVGGYHCWAFVHLPGRGWLPVDISEADKHPELRDYYFGNLSENRVAFSRGRDIELVPRQAGPPLNFFVYPYVEVGGAAWPAEKIDLAFAYEDLERPGA